MIKTLLVDDKIGFLDLAKTYLEKENEDLEIDTFGSPKKALELIKNDSFDCIVCDYQLPELNGIELLRKLREELDSKIPFIMFTGKGREEVAIEALNLGANRYIRKGSDPKSQFGVLSDAITQVVERKEVEERLELTNFSLENADVGALWISPQGKIRYANKKVCQELGYEKDELIGMTISDINPDHPDERPRIWEELKKKGEITFETRHKTKKGETYPVEVHSHYLERNGEEYEFAFVRDITERKKAEEELLEAKRSYQELFEKAGDAFFVHDPETGEILDVNEKMCEMYRYSPREIVGKTVEETSSGEEPYTLERAMELIQKAKEEGPQKFEWHAEKKSGETFWVEVTLKVAKINGESRVLASVRDITKRKKAEEELKEAKEKYRGVTENINDLITVVDQEGKILYANETHREVLGYDPEEKLGENAFKYFHPNDRARVKRLFKQGMETGKEKVEARVKCKDGSYRWIESSGNFLPNGKVLIASRDITKRKETEEELDKQSEAMEASMDGMAILDENEEYVYVNDAHARIYGYDSPEELLGKSWKVLYDEEELERFENKVMPQFREEGRWRGEAVGKKKDGTKFSQELSLTALEDGGLICVVRDITERKESEERERFLNSLVTHDIRNRMQVVQGYLDLIREDVGEEGSEKIEKATNSVEKTLNLTDKLRSMIEFTKEGEAKEISVEKLKSLIINAINKDRGEAREKGISLEFEVAEEINGEVKAGHFIEDVVHNLIENAIYHADCEEIKVSVNENQEEITLTVEDDGKGIPDRKKDEIFDLDYSEKPSSGGLGLHLIKKIIQTYDGKIEVKDSKLGGARFDVHLKKP